MLAFLMQVAAYVYEKWSNKWRIKLNPDKCSIVVFKLKSEDEAENRIPHLPVRINGKLIKNKQSEKFLGLTFDNFLTWETHLEEVLRACRYRLRLLRTLRWRNVISKETTIKLYNSLIFSKISYGMPAWLSLSERQKKKIQVLQNDVLRLANRVTRRMRRRVLELHDDAELPLVKNRFISIIKRYFERKSDDPMMLPVKRRLEERSTRSIGWHRRIFRALNT